MPILRSNNKNIFFCHIPKCAGSSVEQWLIKQGFEISFLNTNFCEGGREHWSRSSPQHILYEDRINLFYDGFFDYEFAIIRDPVDRFLSAFSHNRKKIGYHLSLASFIRRMERNIRSSGAYFGRKFDNHFLPAVRFLSPNTKLLPFEKGIDYCLKIVSDDLELVFIQAESDNIGNYGPKSTDNKIKSFVKKYCLPKSPKRCDLPDSVIKRIVDLYAEDYSLLDLPIIC